MFLSRMFSATPVLGGLLVAAAALLPAGQASAQAPNNNVSKFDRANAGVVLPPAYWSAPQAWTAPHAIAPQAYYAAAVPQQPAPGPLVVTVTMPRQSPPLLVDVRGVDGVVRAYPVERGLAGIETRQVIVRQGETASFRFVTAAVPPK